MTKATTDPIINIVVCSLVVFIMAANLGAVGEAALPVVAVGLLGWLIIIFKNVQKLIRLRSRPVSILTGSRSPAAIRPRTIQRTLRE